jgi:hypothetical protein
MRLTNKLIILNKQNGPNRRHYTRCHSKVQVHKVLGDVKKNVSILLGKKGHRNK